MSNTENVFECDILHIRPEPLDNGCRLPHVSTVEAILASVPVKTLAYPDVYRALARLCASQSVGSRQTLRARAVIVCVDDLGAAELEFFTLLARTRPDLSVHVYGHERFESRMKEAAKLGVVGRATEDVIRSIADEAHKPTYDSCEPSVDPADVHPASMLKTQSEAMTETEGVDGEPETVPPAPSDVEERVVRDDRDSSPDADAVTQTDETEQESGADPVRVPWLRYGDKPTREAPKRVAPLPPEPPQPEKAIPPITGTPADEPLLTQAELEALLGNDIAAIAPKEQPTPDSKERQDGDGSS